MAEAFAWGLIAAGSLLLGALVVQVHTPRPSNLGLVLGFGAGVLLSAVSYELVEEAASTAEGAGSVALGFFAGAIVYYVADRALERMEQRGSGSSAAESSAVGIVLGTVLDGIPESAVLGLTLLQEGTVGVTMLVAVFISNLPESIAASSELIADGWSRTRVYLMWLAVVGISGLSALAGYTLLDGASSGTIAFVLAFAGGAILCMLTSTMIPDAYQKAGLRTGLASCVGFAVAFFISYLES